MAYFTNTEFLCKCRRPECEAPKFPVMELVERLTHLRMLVNEPLIIASGMRCPKWNAESGGKTNSEHLTGEGVDIKCDNSTLRMKLLKYGINAGFLRMGIGKEFVHFGVSKGLAPHVCWTYYA